MSDSEVTQIHEAPESEKKRKKKKRRKKQREESVTEQVSIEKTLVASEVDDRTRVGANTYVGIVFDPLQTIFLSIFPGGGLVYLGRSLVAALIVLPVCLLCATAFAGFSGLLPAWLSDQVIGDVRRIQWPFSLSYGALFFGYTLIGFWLGSLILATTIAVRSLPFPYRSVYSKIWLNILVPVPVLPYYLEGRFWRGHLDLFLVLMSLVSLISGVSLWHHGPGLPPGDVAAAESALVLSGLVMALAAGGVTIGFFQRTLTFLREIGWVSKRGSGKQPERKFVILGLGVVIYFLLYVFAGNPSHTIQEKLFGVAWKVEQQGFVMVAEKLRKPVYVWKESTRNLHEYFGAFDAESPQM